MKRSVIVRLHFSSERQLDITFRALQPEAQNPPTKRIKSTLEKEDKFLILKIEARDTIALRAALNAYLRWIKSVKDVFELLQTNS